MEPLAQVIAPRRRRVGDGTVRRLLPVHDRRTVGPFILVDRMGPTTVAAGAGIDIDAHPHIGLSTLTYLLEGRLVHRDSTGAVQAIAPGDVNWMTAGAGVCHTERSHPDDRPVATGHDGLQLWVALPDHAQDGDPSFEHHPADGLPVVAHGASQVRLVAGTGWAVQSPVRGSSPLVLAMVTLTDSSPVPLEVDHPEVAVLPLDGDATVGGRPLAANHLGVLADGARPEVAGSGRVVVLGGESVGPRRIWWNFVHRDQERIDQAKRDWAEQRFAAVPGDHDRTMPLPS